MPAANKLLKLQRPLMTNDPEPKALVTNKSRSVYAQLPYAWVQGLFEEDELKFYFYGYIDNKTGLLHINGRAPEQDW